MTRPTAPRLRTGAGPRRQQAGLAALLVVMLLFFIMSMVAAYTSRNLIFEQKTSANQLRSTQSFEAADAGMQWALGLLNSGRIDASCLPSTDLGNNTFRQRYLSLDGTTGAATPRTQADGSDLQPSCVFNGTNWSCSCPANGAPAVGVPAGSAVFPAFRVRFKAFAGSTPQIFRVEVVGCTRYSEDCLRFTRPGSTTDTRVDVDINEGRTYATALLTLKGALTSVPTAALTAQGDAGTDVAPIALSVANTNPKGSGLTIQAGGAVKTTGLVQTIAGSVGAQSTVAIDASLAALTPDLMFNSVFGLSRASYRDQAGAVVLPCGGTCTAAQLRAAAAQNPGRILWVDGNLNFDSAGDVGSAAEPLAIVVNGNVQFASPVTVHGLVYVQAATWNTAGGGTINGAAIAEGAVGGNGTTSIVYDKTVLDLVRFRTGTMVILPGSWRDF